jgi:hypothetical protein
MVTEQLARGEIDEVHLRAGRTVDDLILPIFFRRGISLQPRLHVHIGPGASVKDVSHDYAKGADIAQVDFDLSQRVPDSLPMRAVFGLTLGVDGI